MKLILGLLGRASVEGRVIGQVLCKQVEAIDGRQHVMSFNTGESCCSRHRNSTPSLVCTRITRIKESQLLSVMTCHWLVINSMRLLNVSTLQLYSCLDDQVPPYAILSYFWTQDEVLFEDLQNGELQSNLRKDGWATIKYCCTQAEKDALEWLWVGTFYIEKTSGSELPKATSSMFRWYAEASICYAYLADVRDLHEGKRSSEEVFSETRLFSRG
jgi:hypothetical protein